MNDSTLLTIKEFSEFAGITQSTLRYYDEIGLLPASERGENNYRYYTPFQLITLNFINVLVDLGIPLSTIKELTARRTPESMIDLLSRQEVILDYKLYELRTAYSIIHTYRNNIQDGLFAREGDVSVREFDEARIILGPENSFESNETFYWSFINFCNSAKDYRINLRYPIGGYHLDMQSFLKAPGQPERYFSFDPVGNIIREKGKYLVGYERGYYGEFDKLPGKMAAYAKTYDLIFTGPVFVIYLHDEVSVVDPNQFMARVMVPVSSKKTAHD